MKNRIHAFDYIRAISIIGIVICHCCFAFSTTDWIGRYLANSFNFIFLILSAFLLGMSWEKKGFPQYNINFVSHRIKRLAIVYYPFLITMFTFLSLVHYSYTIKDIIIHITFLQWFKKIDGFGHLWFLTMIVICYIFMYISIYINKYNWGKELIRLLFQSRYTLIIFLPVILLLQFIAYKFNLPGQIFLYLFLYLVFFMNALNILTHIKQIQFRKFVFITIILNIIALYLFYRGIFEYKIISYPLGCLCGLSIMGIIYKTVYPLKEIKCVKFISTISFEIYLIHHALCFGRYSVYQLGISPLIGFIIIMGISITLGYILHYFSNKLINKILIL